MKALALILLISSPAFAGPVIRQNGSNQANSAVTISTLTLTNGIAGVVDGSNAAAGNWGEFISTTPTGVASPAATTAFVSIATTTLSPGDWDASGIGILTEAGTYAGTDMGVCVSLTPNACDSVLGRAELSVTAVANSSQYIPSPIRRISVSATTTVYLTATLTYTVLSTTQWSASSYLRARRIR